MTVGNKKLTLFVAGFFLLWALTWLVHGLLAGLLSGSVAGDTAYWLAAKVIIWLAYPVAFFREKLSSQLAYIGLDGRHIKKGLAYGQCHVA